MDDDIEIIIPDSLDDCNEADTAEFSFSQVQIQVHGADVAEQILRTTNEQENIEYGPAEYLHAEFDDDGIQELSDESNPDEEIIPDNTDHYLIPQNGIGVTVSEEAVQNVIMQLCMNISDSPDTENLELGLNTEDVDISEIPDELDNVERIPDKELSKYDAVIDYPNIENVSVKEEIEPFMGTDYTNFDAHPYAHYDEEELPPEDIYHYNSKIILGTKPCTTTSKEKLQSLESDEESNEEIDITKENLNAFVALEDWESNLRKSKCFCKSCGRLFATPNALMAHNTSEHSFLVPIHKNVAFKSTSKSAHNKMSNGAIVTKPVTQKNSARKSTGIPNPELTCYHCNKVFSSLNILNNHLYSILLKKYSCDICNVVCKSVNDLVAHNATHVNEKIQVKLEKVENTEFKKKLIYEEDLKKRPAKIFETIPQSVLFQCPNCDLNVTSAFGGFSHFNTCVNGKSNNNHKLVHCRICKKKFTMTGIVPHMKQHKISSKFKVYKITKSVHEKTLCKCPKCLLHFSDYGMRIHIKSCGSIPSALCPKCNILLPEARLAKHVTLHTELNLKPKDFIIVPHVIVNEKRANPVKRKLNPPNVPTKKIKLEFSNVKNKYQPKANVKKEPNTKPAVGKRNKLIARLKFEKNSNKIKVFYCRHCNCSAHLRTRKIDHHVSKACLNKMSRKSKYNSSDICMNCGLYFTTKTLKYHLKIHKQRPLTIHDMDFYDMESLKRITPKMPKYPQCTSCKINFFERKMLRSHICGEDYETCNVCNQKFHSDVFEMHTEFHQLRNKRNQKPNAECELIPEILKKYESLNMMWNIVFSCQKCEIVTDEYDKAVEHSQGHLYNEVVTKNIKCYICNLKFDETCWSKHSMLHSQMTIDYKDLKILNYNPKKLLTDEWFELFSSLPEEQIKQITSKSLYGFERRFKIKLLKEGRSEFTLYCCSDCKVCIRDNEIEKHINGSCKNCGNICKICSVPFCDISTLKNHQILHIKGIKKEEFRVVMFTKTKENVNELKGDIKPVKVKLNFKQNDTKQSNSKNKVKSYENKINGNRNTVSYKCPKKGVKGLIKNSDKQKGRVRILSNKIFDQKKRIDPDLDGKFVLHKCVVCNVCAYRYNVILAHKCDEPLFECMTCENSFALKTRKAHCEFHKGKPKFGKETCKVLPYDPKQTVKEKTVTKHKKNTTVENNDDNVKIIITPPKLTKAQNKYNKNTTKTGNAKESLSASTTAVVYRCVCGLHYTSLKNIEKHALSCPDDEISKENCSKCGLLFPTDILVSHLCKHHSKNSEFTIELYNNVESTSKSQMPISKNSSINDSETTTKTARSNLQEKSRIGNRAETTSKTLSPSRNTISTSKYQHKLYKCSECNVYYVTHGTCYSHIKNHKPINSIKCIDCKICGLQFTVTTLPAHIYRHHGTTFDLANVLVEEYTPRVGKTGLKKDVYVAAVRVQSLQVSSSIGESEVIFD